MSFVVMSLVSVCLVGSLVSCGVLVGFLCSCLFVVFSVFDSSSVNGVLSGVL